MANWIIQAAEFDLRPFRKRIRSGLPIRSVIHADETVMRVHREKGKGFEIDDLLPRSEEVKPWFSAVCMPGTAIVGIGGLLSGYIKTAYESG